MTYAPVIETERLILRPNREEDFEPYAAFYATPRADLRGGRMDRAAAWRMFTCEIGHWHIRGYGFWGVEDKATGAYCGQVGLWNPEGWAEPEIGWLLMPEAEGRGVAHEAALRARAYAYDTLGWTRVVSCISEGNARSVALAERLGATFEYRHKRPGQPDHLVYVHPAPETLQ